MSDVGVIVTGLVGATGIVATFLQAQLSGRREDRRAKRTAKQVAYVNCVTAIDAVRAARTHVAVDRIDQAASDALNRALADAITAVNTLALIAPANVFVLGHNTLQEAANVDSAGRSSPLHGHLLAAMRADLGERPYRAGLREPSATADRDPAAPAPT